MENTRKSSKKRQAILGALLDTVEHPSAEMLYSRLKADYPELSLGTVYRNLAVLAEEGLVINVGNVDGQERYDARTAPHPHFVCRDCHRVLDLALPDMVSGLYGTIDREYGCRCESYSLSVSGLCPLCRKDTLSTARQ